MPGLHSDQTRDGHAPLLHRCIYTLVRLSPQQRPSANRSLTCNLPYNLVRPYGRSKFFVAAFVSLRSFAYLWVVCRQTTHLATTHLSTNYLTPTRVQARKDPLLRKMCRLANATLWEEILSSALMVLRTNLVKRSAPSYETCALIGSLTMHYVLEHERN